LIHTTNPTPNFKHNKQELSKWLKDNPDNITNTQTALKTFAETFDDKLLEFSGREE